MHACRGSETANSYEDTPSGAVTAVQSPTMAEDNVEYDLLEDVGEELDYEDFTLEDEDLGECHLLFFGTCTCPVHFVLFD